MKNEQLVLEGILEPEPLNKLEKPLKFILAGAAIFTVVSLATQTRFTFKVTKLKKEHTRGPKELWFVKVRNGSEYSYLGTVFKEHERLWYHRSNKSRLSQQNPMALAWTWLFQQLNSENTSNQIEIFHEGQCGRCARRLTVPSSIQAGYGPECLSKIY